MSCRVEGTPLNDAMFDATREIGKASELYGIDAIPEIILLAPDGTILLRGNRMDAIEQKLAEIFSE